MITSCFQSNTVEKKIKYVICRPWSVHIGKNFAQGLQYGRQPVASGCTQDLGHSFSQYGPPGQQITYMYLNSAGILLCECC